MSGGKTDGVSRRGFVKGTAAAAGAFGVTSFSFVPAGALGQDGQVPPSERIGIALVGCGGMGQGNLANCARHPDVQVTAVCDAWGSRLAAAGRKYTGAKTYPDHRELLQDNHVEELAFESRAGSHLITSFSETLVVCLSAALLIGLLTVRRYLGSGRPINACRR